MWSATDIERVLTIVVRRLTNVVIPGTVRDWKRESRPERLDLSSSTDPQNSSD